MNAESQPGRVVALAGDLIFASKISAAAEACGVALQVVRSPEQARAAFESAAGLLIDLDVATDAGVELIAECKQTRPASPVLAFLPHVERELARRAVDAGADTVLSRLDFTRRLPELLTALAAGQPIE